jgi:hypothetical protein
MKDSVNILGVDIPLATIAYATSGLPTFATLSDWVCHFNESDLEILKSVDKTVFDRLASRDSGKIPFHAGVNRQIFQYKNLSKQAYEGSI